MFGNFYKQKKKRKSDYEDEEDDDEEGGNFQQTCTIRFRNDIVVKKLFLPSIANIKVKKL